MSLKMIAQMKQHVLLTGANGFNASHILSILLEVTYRFVLERHRI